jgi:hypothetical protein
MYALPGKPRDLYRTRIAVVFEPLWILAVLGTVILGLGLGSVGYALLAGKELATVYLTG